MPKTGEYDNTYISKLNDIGIDVIGCFCGAKTHHVLKCLICSYTWRATPISKLQNYKKHKIKGCPECTNRAKYSAIRKKNLQKLHDRGIEVLDDGYDGRTYLDYDSDPHLKIKVKNTNCGHIFECSPSNLLCAETECAVCGPQKRVEPLIQWSKANSENWQKTATEWQKYRSIVHNLTVS